MRVKPDERGATTVMVALLLSCLLAAAGIGIDTTSMAYQRSRVQHAADASALAIAQTCKAGPCNTALAGTYLASNAAGGGADSVTPIVPGPTSVTVTIRRTVKTMFFGLEPIKIGSKDVVATSTASWNISPTSGNVQPYLAALCEFTNAPIGQSTFLDTNSNDRLFTNAYKNKDQSVLETNNDLTPSCGTIPTGVTGIPSTTRMIKGGLWKSTNNGCNASLSNGKSVLNVGDNETVFALCAENTQQTDKYGQDGDLNDIHAGEVSLFAIYAPTANFQYGGVITSPVGGTSPTSKIDGSPTFKYKIVGFAPFLVDHYRLGKSSNPCHGSGCVAGTVGIWGKFVNAISPDATYTPGGPNIGSVVKLIN